MLDIYLDSGFTVVVLSNVDDGMQPVAQKRREVVARRAGDGLLLGLVGPVVVATRAPRSRG